MQLVSIYHNSISRKGVGI